MKKETFTKDREPKESNIMETINDWKEIPLLEEEIDEANYWLTHQLSPKLMNSSIHQPDCSQDMFNSSLRYPEPIVSHQAARINALTAYQSIKNA